MANSAEKKQVEIFLIKTLTNIEHKFQPRRIRLIHKFIGRLKWELGDIAVRRLRNGGHEFDMIPRTPACFDAGRGEISTSLLRYTQVTIELVTPPDSVAPTRNSYDGTTLTFRTEYSEDPVLRITWNDTQPESFVRWPYLEYIQDTQAVCYNKNKLQLKYKKGTTRYLLRYGLGWFETRSFSSRDILLALVISQPFHGHPSKLTLWRPLWFFWTDEHFELRVVAQEIEQHKHTLTQTSVLGIDRALRFLIDRMVDRRRAINDHLVTLLLDTASNLRLQHPLLEKMKLISGALNQLSEMQMQVQLPSDVIHELIRFDLKHVLPISETQMNQLCADLGQSFTDQVMLAFESQGGALPQFDERCMRVWHLMIEALVLHAALTIDSKSAQTIESKHLVAPEPGPTKLPTRVLRRFTDNNSLLTENLHRYTKLLLYWMPRFAEQSKHDSVHTHSGIRITHAHNDSLVALANLISESCGYLVHKMQLVCWQRTNNESYDRVNTSATFVDLAALESTLMRELEEEQSAGVPNEDWKISFTFPNIQTDSTFIDFIEGALYVLRPKDLLVVRFTPEISQRLYQLPEGTSLQYPMPKTSNDLADYHTALCHSPQFNMVLLADVWAGRPEPTEEQTRIDLYAFGIRNSEMLSLVASRKYPSPCIPIELSLPWELPNWRLEQGYSPNTYNLPFSPLRWRTTQSNVYCLWLLSPQSHIVYGLKGSTFVVVSSRHSYGPPTVEQPFVLRSFVRDRSSGMTPLFVGKKVWDHQKCDYYVSVYQIRLRHW